MKIEIKQFDKNRSFNIPVHKTEGSAGLDLYASLERPVAIRKGEVEVIPTNVAIALENGFEAQIRNRSSLSTKHGLFVINSPGTIDSDYRGEIKVPMTKLIDGEYIVNDGDRIAQMVISPFVRGEFVEVEELDQTDRGDGGFGSTGLDDKK